MINSTELASRTDAVLPNGYNEMITHKRYESFSIGFMILKSDFQHTCKVKKKQGFFAASLFAGMQPPWPLQLYRNRRQR